MNRDKDRILQLTFIMLTFLLILAAQPIVASTDSGRPDRTPELQGGVRNWIEELKGVVAYDIQEKVPLALLALERAPESYLELMRQHLDLFENEQGELMIEVLVRSYEDPAEMARISGLSIETRIGDIFTCRLPLHRLTALARLKGVVTIEPSVRLMPLLDKSIVDNKTHLVWLKTGTTPPVYKGLSGKGVLIGLVDSGIDWTHPDFIRPNYSYESRIESIWDQNLSKDLDESVPAGFSYGVEYTRFMLNNKLAGNSGVIDVRHSDSDGHGTHVAGIAAGNGASSGNPSYKPAYTYIGMAPEASLVVVASDYTSAGVVDGVQYIMDKRDQLAIPVAINLSLGSHYGAHDGTSLFEQALDAFVGVGKMIVAAAGNDQQLGFHASGTLSTSTTTSVGISIPVYTPRSGSSNDFVLSNLWYDGGNSIEVNLAFFNGTTRTVIASTTTGNSDLQISSAGTALVDCTATNNSNGDQMCLIELYDSSASQPPWSGQWYIDIRGISLTGSNQFDAWIHGTDFNGNYARFTTGRDNSKLVAIPATANKITAAGAYTTKACWDAKDGANYCEPAASEDAIATFSAHGPTRDGRHKPDISAAGEVVVSALSSTASDIPASEINRDNTHAVMSGTSMAAPHITGAAALYFQYKSSKSGTGLRDVMTSEARVDSNVGSAPNDTWGYGKLDVYGLFSPDDADSDGIPDGIDNCPEQNNPGQADADGDFIGDLCDLYNAPRAKTGEVVFNEIYHSANADTNNDKIIDTGEDEFLEIVNTKSQCLDISGYVIEDLVSYQAKSTNNNYHYKFEQNTILPPNGAMLIFGGGTPKGSFGGLGPIHFVKTGSGTLSLNNSGDTVVFATEDLKMPENKTPTLSEARVIDIHQFGTGSAGKSWNRSPEISGSSWLVHDAVSGAVGTNSPGTKVNGTLFFTPAAPDPLSSCYTSNFQDVDGDKILDSGDNCEFVFNNCQDDQNNDGTGDVCLIGDILGSWSLNEASGSTAYDATEYQKNGTIFGATRVLSDLHVFLHSDQATGAALKFDGVNDYLSIPKNSLIDPQNGVSYEFWFKPSSDWKAGVGLKYLLKIRVENNKNSNFIRYNGVGSNHSLSIGYSDDEGNPQYTPASYDVDLSANTWYHLVATFKDAYLRLYLDNGIVAERYDADAGQLNGSPVISIASLDGSSDFADVTLDEINIYGHDLSAGEVYDRYTSFSSPRPVAEYLFKEGGGNTAYDSSGNNLNGQISGPLYVNSTIGSYTGTQINSDFALQFDGLDDTVSMSNDINLKPTFLTLAVWFKLDDFVAAPGSHIFFLAGQDSDVSRGYSLKIDTNTKTLKASVGLSSGLTITSGALSPNIWYFAAMTFDGNMLKLYLNANKVAETSAPDYISYLVAPFYLGGQGKDVLHGELDEVRLWDRALSDDEIIGQYRNYGANGDDDKDVVCDNYDNCRLIYNPDQADSDQDLIGNVCDNCPSLDNTDQKDQDVDAIGDVCDNCPTVANQNQLDSDSDTVGNACDNCPTRANSDQKDSDGDGIGDLCDNCLNAANTSQKDTDGDGIGDVCDNCPARSNASQTDGDGDGIGDLCDNCPSASNTDQKDTDKDTIGDLCDNCPAAANTNQLDSDSDGIGSVCDNCPSKVNANQNDSDFDGIGDVCDNCPSDANTSQNDTDSDTVGDSCDNCPNSANSNQKDSDGDRIGDSCDNCPNDANVNQNDFDVDGLGDKCDNCPLDANSLQTDTDGDLIGDACDNCLNLQNADQKDNDVDGVGNVCDNCIDAKNPDQLDSDSDGIGNACEVTSSDKVLRALWKFNEGTGATTADLTCNFYGTSQPNNLFFGSGSAEPAWAEGKFGDAISLDGVDEFAMAVDTLHYPDFNLAEEYFTIEVWVKLNSSNMPTDAYIVSQFKSGTPRSGWGIRFEKSGSLGKFGAMVSDGTHTAQLLTGTFVMNSWYHLALLYNPDLRKVSLYVNGVEKASQTVLMFVKNLTNRPIVVGAREQSSPGNYELFFQGLVDEIRITQGLLDATEFTSATGSAPVPDCGYQSCGLTPRPRGNLWPAVLALLLLCGGLPQLFRVTSRRPRLGRAAN